jgi:hypothetical protein
MFDTLEADPNGSLAPNADGPPSVPLERLEAQICELAGHLAAATCRFLVLLGDFDARRGWASWEMNSCAEWLSWKCQMGSGTAREHARVARALRDLPPLQGAVLLKALRAAAGDLEHEQEHEHDREEPDVSAETPATQRQPQLRTTPSTSASPTLPTVPARPATIRRFRPPNPTRQANPASRSQPVPGNGRSSRRTGCPASVANSRPPEMDIKDQPTPVGAPTGRDRRCSIRVVSTGLMITRGALRLHSTGWRAVCSVP